jgi:hypothetical protein
VEEERLRLGDGRPGRWQLTLGRMAGEAPRAGGWRWAREAAARRYGKNRDGLGRAVACWTDWKGGNRLEAGTLLNYEFIIFIEF